MMTKLNKELFFTVHQLQRMAKRGMSKAIVQSVVRNGEWKEGNQPFSHAIEYNGIIVILYEQKTQFNVSSCKLNRENTIRAERISEELGIDFWKATHKIVKELSKDFADI